MINLLIADDQQIFLDGLRLVLEKNENFKVIGEAKDGNKVIDFLQKKSVDIVLLDIDMADGMDGIETTKMIKKNFSNTKILILSSYCTKQFVTKLMNLGASGYLLKNCDKNELFMAINNVYVGKSHFGLKVLDQIVGLPLVEEEKLLTERQIEIMCKVAAGKSTAEIAEDLNIAEVTVSTHRRALLAKLELKNAAQLTYYAIKNGYAKM